VPGQDAYPVRAGETCVRKPRNEVVRRGLDDRPCLNKVPAAKGTQWERPYECRSREQALSQKWDARPPQYSVN